MKLICFYHWMILNVKLQQFAKIKPIPPKNVENNREINKNITDNTTISTLYLKFKIKIYI
jgi:hypothetical protein